MAIAAWKLGQLALIHCGVLQVQLEARKVHQVREKMLLDMVAGVQ